MLTSNDAPTHACEERKIRSDEATMLTSNDAPTHIHFAAVTSRTCA